jgi:hypothetical protein
MPYSVTYTFDSLEELQAFSSGAKAKVESIKPKAEAKAEPKKEAAVTEEKVPLFLNKKTKEKAEVVTPPAKNAAVKTAAKKETGETSDEISYSQVADATLRIVREVPEGRKKVLNLLSQFNSKNDGAKCTKADQLADDDFGAYLEGANAIIATLPAHAEESEEDLA